MKVKICGVTNLQDAKFCAKLGAFAIGFNFYSQSPRYVDDVTHIIPHLPSSLLKVGIFVNTKMDFIAHMLDKGGLDLAQVYEDYALPAHYKKRLILALQANSPIDLPHRQVLKQYGYLLLDAPKLADGLLGGTGRLANWTLAKNLAQAYRLILGGGLNPANAQSAMMGVKPFALDTCSGVEKSPGLKDQTLMTQFMKVCKNDK